MEFVVSGFRFRLSDDRNACLQRHLGEGVRHILQVHQVAVYEESARKCFARCLKLLDSN